MTKAELKRLFELWRQEELDSIIVIEALGEYLGPSETKNIPQCACGGNCARCANQCKCTTCCHTLT